MLTYTARGTAYATGIDPDTGDPTLTSLTIPNVTVAASTSTLAVVVAFFRTFPFVPLVTTATWNGVSAIQTITTTETFNAPHVHVIYLYGLTPGTHDLVITFDLTMRASAYVTEIGDTRTPVFGPWGEASDSTGQASVVLPTPTVLPNAYIGVVSAVNSGFGDDGTFTGGFTVGQVVINGDDDDLLIEGYQIVSAVGTYPVSHVTTHDERWCAVEFSLYTGRSSPLLGGYTSYDLDLTDPEIGAQVLPEVEERIRRGDRRFLEGR